jgi:hypothetical protein
MRYNTRKEIPGDYGYRCKNCGNVAFAFIKGEEMPSAGEYMEDIAVSQRGVHASLRRSQHICQHCAAPVSSVGGRIDMECVVRLDTYAKALENRINSQSRRKGGRTVGVVKVDREYMGCGLTEDELNPPPPPAPVVVEDPPEKPKGKGKGKSKVAAPPLPPPGDDDGLGSALD